jgi:Arc/MetJ-type ribon-helix-helix transcriptional regulator
MARKKAVVSAEPAVLAEVEELVRRGSYATVSAFVREAMADKLARVRSLELREQVAKYCRAVRHDDDELIAAQAFPDDDEP